MTSLPEALRWVHRLALAGLLAVLAACGPGVGGTGTGPSGGNLPSPPSPPPAQIVTAAFERVCQMPCDPVVLDLGTQKVALATGCSTFTATGSWMGHSPLVLQGDWQTVTAAGTTTVVTTLRVDFHVADAGPQRATVELRDSANQLLLGPLELQRNDAASAPPLTPCP